MLNILFAAVLVLQPPPLTSADVGDIVTTVFEAPAPRSQTMRLGDRPLRVDLQGSTSVFERLLGRSLPVDTARWLPRQQYTPATRDEALSCEQITRPVMVKRCIVRDGAAWVHVRDVRAGDTPGQLTVQLQVSWTEPFPKGGAHMVGYIRSVVVEKVNGTWRVVRELPAIVG